MISPCQEGKSSPDALGRSANKSLQVSPARLRASRRWFLLDREPDNSEAVWLPIWSKITTEGTSARCFVSLIRAVEPAWDRHGSRVAQGNSKRAARFRRAVGSFRRTSANRWRLH